MRVALQTLFAASKKEPLAEMLDRVHQAFLDAGLGEPELRFTFGDAPVGGTVSSVDRVLKRLPDMQRFLVTDSPMPNLPEMRRLSNAVSGTAVLYSAIREIAAGIPRSFPFHNATILFHAPAFGEMISGPAMIGQAIPGVIVTDSWWINGRNRSLSALSVVEAAGAGKKLPPHPEAVAAVLAACGKAKRTTQIPLSAPGMAPPEAASIKPETLVAIRAKVQDYRGRIREIVAGAALPHDLPPESEIRMSSLGLTSGPLKPALERVFKPMGYACRGASGTFTLRRRTPANLTAQLYLDVGTWSHQVTAIFQVLGVSFKASLTMPVTVRSEGGQYPIGDAVRWQQIVENLAALVTELDRSFVPEIEAIAGPSPEWFEPEA